MLGIQNLKIAVSSGIGLAKQIAEATADKKVTIMELFGFLPAITGVMGTVKKWPDIRAELKDLSTTERAELHSHIAMEFDIANDKVEVFIENALMNVVSLANLIEEWKNLKR
jgi:hypothetical protein